MNSTARVKSYRERQALMNRFKRESYLTDEEWFKVKEYIKKLKTPRV